MNSLLYARGWRYFLLLFIVFFPSPGFAGAPLPNDPWISLEKSLLQIHKQYDPDAPLLSAPSFSEGVKRYLDAGFWSSAEQQLEAAPSPLSPDIERLWLHLRLKRGRYELIYEAYQRDPTLFQGRPGLLLGASQGALSSRDFQSALALLNRLHFTNESVPEQYYFSVLAYWGLQKYEKIDLVLENAMQWIEEHPDSPWTERLRLLGVYYYLNQKEFDLAFQSMGELFDNNTDLALLALTWGYFKLGATSNLFSILQALDARQVQSPYHAQIYRILSRFLIQEGNLRGAVAMDQKERDELHKQIKILEKEIELLRRGISSSSLSTPPGSLLSKTLSKLKNKIGEKREMTALFWYIDLQQRRQIFKRLKARERVIDSEQRTLQMEMVRRCLSLEHNEHTNSAQIAKIKETETKGLYLEARQAAHKGDTITLVKRLQEASALGGGNPYGLESTFRLGEIAFSQGHYPEAETYYRQLLTATDFPLYPLALYKLGWAYYLQGKVKEAVSIVIKQEIILETPAKDEGPCVMVRTPQERREPYRLLALSLKKLGGPNHLIDLVREIKPEARFTFVSKVTDFYQNENKQDEMFQVIRSWITAYPRYLKTPLLHQKMVSLIRQSETVPIEAVVAARAEFIRNYQPGSPWAEENYGAQGNARKNEHLGAFEEFGLEGSRITFIRKSQINHLNVVKPLLKKHLRFLMTHYYAEAKKNETSERYKGVLPWYQRYLFIFSDEKEIGQDRFLYAGILLNLKNYEEAMDAYRESAYGDPSHPLSSEAGYQEMLLIEKIYGAPGPEIEAAYDRFATRFPKDPRSDEIAMQLAEVAFDQGDFDKSRFYAKQVSLKALSAQSAAGGIDMSAHRLVVQGFLRENSFLKAINFLNNLFSKMSRESQKKALEPLLVLSYFQHGEHLKEMGTRTEAAEAYWQAYAHGKETKMGPLSLFEAASLWDQVTTRKKAEKAFLLFSEHYPKSALHHPALVRLAVLYQGSGRPLKGAETYVKAAALPISTELSKKALDQAIELYISAEAWEKVYHLAMERADTVHLASPFKAKPKERGRWMVMAAEATLEMGKSESALKILARLIEEAKEDKTVSPFVAQAHFLLGESKIGQFAAIKLVDPLEENLQKKKNLLEDLLENYDHAVTHPSLLTALNANFRIGEVYEEFSRSLLESERPEDLSLEEEALYENLLIEQALPYFKRAEDAYLQNIETGKETGVQSEWISKSKTHLFMIEQQIDIFNRGEQEVLG